MNIQSTITSAKVVIESLIALLENEDVDISSIKFRVGNQEEISQSKDMSFEALINLTLKELEKAQAVPEGFVLVEKDLIHSIYQSCIECLDVDVPPIFRATVCTIRDEVEPLIEPQEST